MKQKPIENAVLIRYSVYFKYFDRRCRQVNSIDILFFLNEVIETFLHVAPVVHSH